MSVKDFGLKDEEMSCGIYGVDLCENGMSVQQLEKRLRAIYLSGVGAELNEFVESNPLEEEWVYNTFEREMSVLGEEEGERDSLRRMLESEQLDQFLQKKHGTFKRYGCEGAETMLVMLDRLFRQSEAGGVELGALPPRR